MLFSPEDHAANGPETWHAVKVGYQWSLLTRDGSTITGGHRTKRAAEQDKVSGWAVNLYEKERRYYAGEDVPGWKPSPYRVTP